MQERSRRQKKRIERRIEKTKEMLYIFEWDKEQNQNWNIHERFERRFSKLWLCERIYKSTNRRHMWSKETFSGNGGNFFVKACAFSVLASRVC